MFHLKFGNCIQNLYVWLYCINARFNILAKIVIKQFLKVMFCFQFICAKLLLWVCLKPYLM